MTIILGVTIGASAVLAVFALLVASSAHQTAVAATKRIETFEATMRAMATRPSTNAIAAEHPLWPGWPARPQ